MISQEHHKVKLTEVLLAHDDNNSLFLIDNKTVAETQ